MHYQHSHCTFPLCPVAPDWQLDWESIQQRFAWIHAMADVPQEPLYHAEGDVLIHTRMVVESLLQTPVWRNLPSGEQAMLFASALLHDVGKPACTRTELDGRISSRGHARRGEMMTRRLLWTGAEGSPVLPLEQREYLARLVRLHGLPLRFLEQADPVRAVIAASQHICMDHLALLAEADVRGRICADQRELLEMVELFRDFCREQGCYTMPRPFASQHSRFEYFQNEQRDPDYQAYKTSTFEVVLLSGLPGTGKDTWIRTHQPDWPVISLDSIRKELGISPEEEQGLVAQTARERARILMRRQQSFVWNATNITRSLRRQLVDLFVSYNAHVRLVYLEAPYSVLLQRNRERHAHVPEAVIMKLLDKLEVPDTGEAHSVEWIRV